MEMNIKLKGIKIMIHSTKLWKKNIGHAIKTIMNNNWNLLKEKDHPLKLKNIKNINPKKMLFFIVPILNK